MLNHVLRPQAWARERLQPFAGRALEVSAPPWPRLRLAVTEDGLLAAAPADAEPAVTVHVKPQAPGALLLGEDYLLRAIEVTGDPQFAQALHHLARNLRWDYEEDLSRVFGDVLGVRLAEGLRGLAAWPRDAAHRLAESAAAYASDEKSWLVRRAQLEDHAAEVARLRDAVDRLEQRVRLLGPTP